MAGPSLPGPAPAPGWDPGSVLLLLVFLLCAMEMAGGSYNPFIYFRF